MTKSEAELILGLDFGYTVKDVHKRFRHLSLSVHPDHGGDHDLFLRLLDAKDLLLDSAPKTHSAKEPSIFIEVDINLEWLLEADPSPLEVSHKTADRCMECNGTGSLDHRNDSKPCSGCDGMMRVMDPEHPKRAIQCPDCYGKGVEFINPCGICGGKGYCPQDLSFKVELQPYHLPRDLIIGGVARVSCEVSERGKDCFRKENDLYIKYYINILDIVTNRILTYRDPMNDTFIDLHCRDFVKGKRILPGRGLVDNGRRGDLYLVPEFDFSEIGELTPEAIQIIEDIRKKK